MSGDHPRSERLHGYVLGELDRAAGGEVEEHLAGCAACREDVASLRTTLAVYREAEPAAADGRILRRLLADQKALDRGRFKRRWRGTDVGMAAAMAALIFLGGVWVGRQGVGATTTRTEGGVLAATRVVPRETTETPPRVSFAVADVDRLGGLASRDTTWN